MATATKWRPRCYVCECFVALEAYDVFYDYYAGAWEEGYTACPKHGGPDRPRVLQIRVERAAYEAELLRTTPDASPESSPVSLSVQEGQGER